MVRWGGAESPGTDPNVWANDPIWDHLGKAVSDFQEIIGGPLEDIKFKFGGFREPRGIVRDYNISDVPDLQSCFDNAFAEFGAGGLGLRFGPIPHPHIICGQFCPNPEFGVAQAMLNLHFNFHDNQGGQMSNFWSPLDFLFLVHHSNIDRLYHDVQVAWQKMKLPQNKQIFGNSHLSLRLRSRTSPDVQFAAQFCVQYAPAVNGPPAASNASAASFENFSPSFFEKMFPDHPPEQRASESAAFGDFLAHTEEKVSSGTPIAGPSTVGAKNRRRSHWA
ncbi:hypothetical protein BDK51DRAFT_51953 [Blyttiomyces helicus]|uniref:Tyrosinase copper-binding domain-containing protein n=1 Tax=Blyttiomyces helicus TaxID=388810 RepID=A0A4P9W0Z9_9FUNG|nr:hypothetical protein BDK51DRAFT_51953 [Blyttiomyces helicus]|eukprot:RKO85774.1 hypothetical protein BDK51DRAFT_51953 [Blyttiomyces helicus]